MEDNYSIRDDFTHSFEKVGHHTLKVGSEYIFRNTFSKSCRTCGGVLDVSATVKAYFALKMIGDDIDAPHMVRAREGLLAHGGAGACNVFTRILLALFGILSWRAVPQIPVEVMLLPKCSRSTSTRSRTGRAR